MIEIWQPRWHDRKVLIARYKVEDGLNTIKFSKTNCFKETYHITGAEIRKHPIETNGKIPCYAVPLDDIICP